MARKNGGNIDLNGPPRVRSRARAAGVNARLLAFLDWWEAFGPFPISVGWKGGLRTDEAEQAALFGRGVTKARTLGETPHGRGGALDLYPVIDGVTRGLDGDKNMTEARAYFAQLGALAKQQGFVWGGDFKSITDLPHIELPDWKYLPMPGRGVA